MSVEKPRELDARTGSYETLLRELGRVIDNEGWQDVVVAETSNGLLLKGQRARQEATGVAPRPADRVIARRELEVSASGGETRRGQRGGVRRLWRVLSRD